MGLKKAKKYLEELQKKQSNPLLWPDYLTGLPDRAAVLQKIDVLYPKLGRYAIAYVRIANIEPYLLKYGYDRHAELIQWAAAILKTVASEKKGTFVGKTATHDFVMIAPKKDIEHLLKKADTLLRRKTSRWYTERDRKRGYILDFENDHGRRTKVGLIRFVASVVDRPLEMEKMELIPSMQRACREAEREGTFLKKL